MKTLALTITVGLMAVLAVPATAHADIVCGRPGQTQVHMLPGGGFLGADPEPFRGACHELARHGYRVRVVQYPVGRYDYRAVAARIPRGGYVVGFSAGGAYALHLAARRHVRGAVAISPPVPEGQQFTREALRRYLGLELPHMPDFAPGPAGSAPAVVFHDPRDMFVDYDATRRYCGRWPRVRMVTSPAATEDFHVQPDSAWLPTVAALARP